MSTPLISVVMPVYNAERYLSEAVDSILAQSLGDFELLAVDDGSKDASKTILEGYASRDARVRVLSRPNTGIVGALNDGLAVARGEFIARMDADDWVTPDRFAKQLAFLRAHPEHVCVGSYFNYMDADGALIKWNPRETDPAAIERVLLSGDGGALIHPVIFLRRSALEKTGVYRAEAQWVEDLDLYLRLARVGKLSNVSEVLLHYRYHTGSVNFTRNEGRHQRKLWVLEDAYRARGLPFDRAAWPTPPINNEIGVEDARDFAISSLRFPGRWTPLKYAFRTLRLAPKDRRSWQTFSYVAKASLGLVPRIR
jgi:glycosyltransferase involved in cell wall biosynthesis